MNRQCTACKPGVRCDSCRFRSNAHFRMYRLARLDRRTADPVAYADQVTSMNDARAALCIAMGVPIEHIDPATGHNLGGLNVVALPADPALTTSMLRVAFRGLR